MNVKNIANDLPSDDEVMALIAAEEARQAQGSSQAWLRSKAWQQRRRPLACRCNARVARRVPCPWQRLSLLAKLSPPFWRPPGFAR